MNGSACSGRERTRRSARHNGPRIDDGTSRAADCFDVENDRAPMRCSQPLIENTTCGAGAWP